MAEATAGPGAAITDLAALAEADPRMTPAGVLRLIDLSLEEGRAVDDATLTAVVESAVRLLRVNARVAAGGRNTTGRSAAGESLWVYNRTTRPCRRCGTAIQSAADGLEARRVYWCPRCQPAVPSR